ncbi:MAG: cyclase family protein, partial [Propionibacteriaceae bacterium]|nr:cyclase family protein [Propionibacteriaceae bacterium]
TVHGAETIAPFFTKGVFLDIPKLKGLEVLPAAYEITADDLQAAAEAEGIELTSGCVVLIRTGWAQHWPDRETFEGGSAGVPGVGGEAAAWLASYSPRACGIDTIAFDPVPVAAETLFLQPAHRILIVENGIHLIETMNLEELSRRGVYEFLFVLSSLRLVGATGAPARPLAIIGHSSLAEG